MKKLMTLLSAAAVAFGLQAADTGTSFEGMTAGDLNITSSTGELAEGTSGYWETNGNEQESLKVVEGQSRPHFVANNNYPKQYKSTSQAKYLEIKTPLGNPADRFIKSDHYAQSIGGGFYFDSLVKFTAFDENPTNLVDFADAKIAVWIQEIPSKNDPEVVAGTNIFVRAGSSNGEHTYDCGPFGKPDEWHRLTIKAISSIYKAGVSVPGFVVFVDNMPVCVDAELDDYLDATGIVRGNLVEAYDRFCEVGALFPSMVQGAQIATYLSSVSFAGQGSVDDIVFTDDAPDFAKDFEYVHITWDSKDIEELTIGNHKLTSDELAKNDFQIVYDGATNITVSAKYVEGKVRGTWSVTGSAALYGNEGFSFTGANGVGDIKATVAAASFNGTSYASLSEAIAAANNATATNQLLKLFGETTASDDINVEGAQFPIKIDLNGRTIGGLSSSKGVWIVDSGVGGTVCGEVFAGDYSRIDAGTFEDYVMLGDGSEIAGGRFNKDNNDADLLPAAPGYVFVVEGDYIVPVPAVDFAVTAGDNSYVSNVSIDNVDVTTDVTNGTITVIASNVAWSVTFTANSGYEFEGGLTTTNFTGTAEAAVDLTGPDASSTSPSEPTIKPGETSIDNVKASSEADATNKVVVASPDSTVVSDANYKKYFTLTAQETGTGVYTVSIALNAEAIELPETLEDVGGDLQDAAAAFGEDEDASFTDIAAKPGLWYWIDTATDPAFTVVTHGTPVFAEGTTVDLEAVKPANADNAVFFRVCVDAVQRVWEP